MTNDDFADNFGGIYAHMTEDQWCGSLGFATGTNGGSNTLFPSYQTETCPTYDYSTYKSDGPIYSGTNSGTTDNQRQRHDHHPYVFGMARVAGQLRDRPTRP